MMFEELDELGSEEIDHFEYLLNDVGLNISATYKLDH